MSSEPGVSIIIASNCSSMHLRREDILGTPAAIPSRSIPKVDEHLFPGRHQLGRFATRRPTIHSPPSSPNPNPTLFVTPLQKLVVMDEDKHTIISIVFGAK
jgi:hypothetical protein